MSRSLALFANLLILGFLGFSGWLENAHPGAYYASAQEDQALEWASFWSFFAASLVFAIAALRQRRAAGALPWFLAGLTVFCFFVAMEEISWAQRVFGHRPPEYFLAENYQQELNLHNLASRDLRVWAFRGIVLGYGMLLPLLALISASRRLLDRFAIIAPPVALVPSMLAIFWLHLQYPWKFTGEIAECALGFAFLFAAMANAANFVQTGTRPTLLRFALIPALVVALSFATAAWSQRRRSDHPSYARRATAEVQALRADFVALAKTRDRDSITKCGLHKRLYTFLEGKKPYMRALTNGAFAKLRGEGLPQERAEFFLDPWNSPYWIRDRCDEAAGRRSVFIYSFGPNRSRDSNRWEILGDDLGAYVIRKLGP